MNGCTSPFFLLTYTWIVSYCGHVFLPDDWLKAWYAFPLILTIVSGVFATLLASFSFETWLDKRGEGPRDA